MTRNQIKVTRLSGCVREILMLHRMLKIEFQQDFFLIPQMLSFGKTNFGEGWDPKSFWYRQLPYEFWKIWDRFQVSRVNIVHFDHV